jgi:hypothetical protein
MAQRMGVIKPMKKLIYCNGDSFTAGVCLADSFLPEYPGHFSWDDLQLKRKVADKFIKLKEWQYQYYLFMCFNCHELIFKSKFYRIQQIVILFNNIVIVIGPTPPGTGDILDTFYNV